jgi:sugar lactone lactonase YvrE
VNELEHLLSVQNELADSPLWVPAEQALYWVDIEGNCIYRFDPVTREYQIIHVDMAVTALEQRASGGWITATKTGLAFWESHRNTFSFIGDPEADTPHVRFNDGVICRQGRFLIGTINEQVLESPDGSLYRLDPDGSIYKLDTGFAVVNGMALSPDNRTLYLVDMFHSLIYAYDYDPATGAVAHRRPFVRMPRETGLPDGLTVDSEGFLWVAHWDGWRVTRYDPSGQMEREIRLPVQNVTSVAFGGANLDELYITTAWYGLSQAQRKEQPLAGDLFRLKTNIKGLTEPAFAG